MRIFVYIAIFIILNGVSFSLISIVNNELSGEVRQGIQDINARREALNGMEGAPYHDKGQRKLKLTKEAKAALAVPDNIKQAHKIFLQQKNTGITRLLKREEKKDQMIVSVQNQKAFISLRFGGAYYSFSSRRHGYDEGPEIALETDLHTGSPASAFCVAFNGFDIGFIIRLGNIELSEAMLEKLETKFLVDYIAPKNSSIAREHQSLASLGIKQNGFLYKRSTEAVENNTYLLRVINYDKSDLLVALRVVSKDSDGSFIILWKIMKKNPIPRIKS